jgi:type I restriction enzyme S subunit
LSGELPEGWATPKLAEIASHKSGNSKLIKGKLHANPAPGRFQGFSASGSDVWCDSWEHEGPAIILSAVGARCGKAFKANGRWCAIANTHVIWASRAIERDFLFLRLNDENFWIKGGTAQPFVKTWETFENLFPLPPVAEQRRIVQKVAALLADVKKAKERLDRVPLILKRFRQAVLAAAYSGELTKEWRNAHPEPAVRPPPNSVGDDELENSDVLSEIPASWAWIALDDACDAVIDYRGRTPPVDPRGKIPHVRTTNVRGGRIDWNTDSFVTEAVYKEYMTRGIPRLGDVIFTMEAPLGDAAVVDRDEKFSLAQRLLLLRGKKDLLEGSFLAYSLQSPSVRRSIEIRATGTTVLGIAYKRFRYVRLPVAPVPEQREIVRRVHEFFAVADAIERRVKAAMARAERLPQAILSKAFTGELVPTEAELARAEGRTYETAEELLRRVTDSEASEPKTRPKPRKRKSA